MKGPTIKYRAHVSECECPSDGPLNTQIDNFNCNDRVELEESRESRNVFDAAKIFVYIRLESSTQMDEKGLRFLHHSSETAGDYKKHLRSYKMC